MICCVIFPIMSLKMLQCSVLYMTIKLASHETILSVITIFNCQGFVQHFTLCIGWNRSRHLKHVFNLAFQSRAYSRIITATQFGRILSFLSLDVGPEEFRLLCRKFVDPSTGDINYPAFVQAVDQGKPYQIMSHNYICKII